MMCKTGRAIARHWIEGLLLVGGALLGGCVYDWHKREDASADLDSGSDGEVDVVDAPGDDSSAEEELDAAQGDGAAPEDELDASSPDAEAPEADAEGSELDGQLPDADEMDARSDVRFCDGVDAFFCADFEDGWQDGSVGFDWFELTVDSGANLGIVDGGTGPGSLALNASLSGVAEEAARVALGLMDNAEPKSVHVAFDLLPQFSMLDGAVFWFKLTTRSGNHYPGVGLATDSEGGNMLLIQHFDGTFGDYAAGDLGDGWVHVEVAINFGSDGSAIVHLNDKPVGSFSGPLHTLAVDQSYLQLGVYSQAPSVSSALFDNVVVHLVP